MMQRLIAINGHAQMVRFATNTLKQSTMFSMRYNHQQVTKSKVNVFHAGVCLNPHIQKKKKGGEDAATLQDNILAVADGVGGWAESGIDPAIFARRLCKNIDELATKSTDAYILDPKRLIIDSVAQNHETGSSTCVIACLDKHKPLMYTANLGDSGYLLLRKSGLDLVQIFKTKEQTHSFNFPFQVGTGGDDPAKADVNEHQIQDKDILVVASDGLWDNLFNVKIIDLIRPFIRDRDDILDPSLVAEIIAKEAERYSNSQNYLSPFGKCARENFYDYVGGKPDDITVIIAQVKLGETAAGGGVRMEGPEIKL